MLFPEYHFLGACSVRLVPGWKIMWLKISHWCFQIQPWSSHSPTHCLEIITTMLCNPMNISSGILNLNPWFQLICSCSGILKFSVHIYFVLPLRCFLEVTSLKPFWVFFIIFSNICVMWVFFSLSYYLNIFVKHFKYSIALNII